MYGCREGTVLHKAHKAAPVELQLQDTNNSSLSKNALFMVVELTQHVRTAVMSLKTRKKVFKDKKFACQICKGSEIFAQGTECCLQVALAVVQQEATAAAPDTQAAVPDPPGCVFQRARLGSCRPH